MDSPRASDAIRLFLIGFLILFLELVMIRYLAGNIWNLGYFPNLVLLAVFVGMGLGFVLHHRFSDRASGHLYVAASVALLVLVGVLVVARPTVPGFASLQGLVGGELYFTASPRTTRPESYLLFVFWFLALVVAFGCLAQRMAKLFRLFSPLRAYTLDISGSCLGIVTFMVLSFLRAPAWTWFLLAVPLFLVTASGKAVARAVPVVSLAAIAAIAYYQDTILLSNPTYRGELEVRWSPYQKIEYINDPRNSVAQGIYANGISHQAILRADQIRSRFYQVPYSERAKGGRPAYRTVLVIGAGTGNDVAAALMNGAERVDAIEIDPVLADLGRRYHPAKPYADPRVNLVIDDARAFLTRTNARYDLIVFALTDSLVKVSSMAQLRLENYVFTEDCIRRAWAVLADGGNIVLYNYYRRPWLIEKFQRMLQSATGQAPLLLHQRDDFAMLAVEAGRQGQPLAAHAAVDIPTDDWPFPYLMTRGVPLLYAGALSAFALLIVGLAVLLHRNRRGEAAALDNAPNKLAFLFMGVAFLLLETKSVVQFSLLFGTTWINSSLVFLGILTLVLAANWCATLIRSRLLLPVVYSLLIISSLVTLVYPLRNLLGIESPALRFVLASLMTFSPVFFANLIFSTSFRDQEVPEHVFGWNLLGATVGGLLEYTSMAIGYNNLAIVVAASYTVVLVFLILARRGRRAAAPGEQPIAAAAAR